jgi:hypothetical protein
MTPEHFRLLCELHDLTYSYSDDRRAWEKGRRELEEVKKAAEELGMATAIPIWNEVVSEKLLPPYDEAYWWKTPDEISSLS